MGAVSKNPTILLCSAIFLLFAGMACGEPSEGAAAPQSNGQDVQDGLPSLIDLGSVSCVPCQMMEDELARLEELAGDRLVISFIDINQDPDAASQYGIRVIPTQVFLAPDGTELARHEGFMSVEQMLSQWIALGYDLYVAEDDTDAP